MEFRRTEDGLPVITGMFRLTAEQGMPLADVIQYLKDREIVIAWDVWVNDARENGWKDKRILAASVAAIGETYGAVYAAEFEKRMMVLLTI